jgi:hypothetical protein
MTSCRTVRECCALLGARLRPNPIPSAVCGGRCHAARKEHATSRVEHRDPVFVVVCPAATAPPLSTERLRCGIMNPQAPVVCSGDVKQQRAHTKSLPQLTVSDNQCSVIARWMLLASESPEVPRMPCCMLCSVTSILLFRLRGPLITAHQFC